MEKMVKANFLNIRAKEMYSKEDLKKQKSELKTQVLDVIDENDIPINLPSCCFQNIWNYKKNLKLKIKEIFENSNTNK